VLGGGWRKLTHRVWPGRTLKAGAINFIVIRVLHRSPSGNAPNGLDRPPIGTFTVPFWAPFQNRGEITNESQIKGAGTGRRGISHDAVYYCRPGISFKFTTAVVSGHATDAPDGWRRRVLPGYTTDAPDGWRWRAFPRYATDASDGWRWRALPGYAANASDRWRRWAFPRYTTDASDRWRWRALPGYTTDASNRRRRTPGAVEALLNQGRVTGTSP
jgi:hypothetical protein